MSAYIYIYIYIILIKNYHHTIFVQYKNNHIILFALYNIKKQSIRENKKNLKRKKKLKIS